MKFKFSVFVYAAIFLGTVYGNAKHKNGAYLIEMVSNSTLMRELDTTWYPIVDSNIYDEIINENGEVTLVRTGTKDVIVPDINKLPIKDVYIVDMSNFFSPGTKCLIGKLNVHIVKTAPKDKKILSSNIFLLLHGIKNEEHIFMFLNKPTNMYEQFFFKKNGPAKIQKLNRGQF